jgi:uncharacterized membrane protein
MTTTMHPLVEDYLSRLDQAARVLPRREREELLVEIRAHLAVGLRPDAGEADVRNALDGLGAPEDIVAAAAPDRPYRSDQPGRGAREVIAIVLLVTGFPPLLGWVVGAILLLLSPAWTGRQKLLGLLVWPGGYAAVLFFSLFAVMAAPVASVGSCIVTGRLSTVGDTEQTTICTGMGSGTPGWHYLVLAIVLAVVLLAPLAVGVYLYRAAGRARTA